MQQRKIEWSEKLTTQIRSLDDHHCDLIDQMNEFSQAVEAGMSQPGLIKLFERILDDVRHHFAFEEKILMNIGFTRYSEHKRGHEALLSDANDIYEELKNASSATDIQPSINFLNALIVKHMAEQDSKISQHIMGELALDNDAGDTAPETKTVSRPLL